jgi:hypothetical protein
MLQPVCLHHTDLLLAITTFSARRNKKREEELGGFYIFMIGTSLFATTGTLL